ncbi:MAG TPA: hypothetical protein VFF52_22910 [Isosphaeraceae bacterium]|nr:hypothetical protein [Isosphaeraceae bacterium]
MPGHEELIQTLAQLDPATLEEVVSAAYRQRSQRTEAIDQERPNPEATAEQFAQWLAQRHLASDMALERVVYLPTGAPADEIRLLEVNRLLNPPDLDTIEPLDFTPDIDPAFKVFVADVTTDQWERIQRTPESILPSGWELKDYKTFTRA